METVSPDTQPVPITVRKDMLSDRDIAERTGLSFRKVRRLMQTGVFPGRKYGGSWMATAGEWQRYVEDGERGEAA